MSDEDKQTKGNEVGPAQPFDSIRNIEVGKARVPYIAHPHGDQPAGWALPGRQFTSDFATAMECAVAMDRAMRG